MKLEVAVDRGVKLAGQHFPLGAVLDSEPPKGLGGEFTEEPPAAIPDDASDAAKKAYSASTAAYAARKTAYTKRVEAMTKAWTGGVEENSKKGFLVEPQEKKAAQAAQAAKAPAKSKGKK